MLYPTGSKLQPGIGEKDLVIKRSLGALYVDKPRGPTSFSVLKQIQKRFQIKKIGHCGTLDPDASGLLIVLIEEATRFQRFVMDEEKCYSGVIQLGIRTNTDDLTGEILAKANAPSLSEKELRGLEQIFSGEYSQIPPQFSAKKKDGVRAYKSARKGEHVELDPRVVTVSKLELSQLEVGRLNYKIRCSKGFYVRSLARDIGDKLECGGATETIHREESSGVSVKDALSLPALLESDQPPIRPIGELLGKMPRIICSQEDYSLLLNGRKDATIRIGATSSAPKEVLIQLNSGEIVGAMSAPDGFGVRRIEFLVHMGGDLKSE